MTEQGPGDQVEEGPEIPEAILREVPKGALALAGLTVGLLVAAWFAMYLLVFLPRGPAA